MYVILTSDFFLCRNYYFNNIRNIIKLCCDNLMNRNIPILYKKLIISYLQQNCNGLIIVM